MAFSNHSLLASSCPNKFTDYDSSKHTHIIHHTSANPPPLQRVSTYNPRASKQYSSSTLQGSKNVLAIADGMMINRMMMAERHAQRLAEARAMFKQMEEEEEDGGKKSSMGILVMIDALQRLSLDHHFEEDIAAVLEKRHHDNKILAAAEFPDLVYNGGGAPSYDDDDDDGLLETSLCFRLLRHQGYRTPSDVFEKFRNEEGQFEANNIMGLLELYEASFWATKEEAILKEASEFCAHILGYYSSVHHHHHGPEYSSSTATIGLADYTLRHPLHRSLPKLNMKNYLSIGIEGMNNTLMDLARLDFNMVQSLHLQEVVQVSAWWKELGLAEELKFARNEPMKWYLWPLAILTDPKFSQERVELAKPISFVYLIDDVFDVYGSLDELTLFTEIVDRWDIASAEQLPDCIRKCLMALDEVTDEIAYKVYKRHGWNPKHSLRQVWAKLFKAFLVEAKWFKTGDGQCPPSAQEYLKNGIVSSGVQVVLVHLFFLLGQGLTQRNVNLITGDDPPVISSVAKLLRMCDDLSARNEEHNGEDGSYLDFYLKENPQSSILEAKEHVMNMIEETWKQLNHEFLSPTVPFPLVFNRAAHNSAKMVPLMYGCEDDDVDQDHHRLPKLEDHIKSLLFESIPT